MFTAVVKFFGYLTFQPTTTDSESLPQTHSENELVFHILQSAWCFTKQLYILELKIKMD